MCDLIKSLESSALSPSYKDVILTKRDNYIQAGIQPKEADRKALLDLHKDLHGDLNELKKSLAIESTEYVPFDNKKAVKSINRKYDELVKAEVEKDELRKSNLTWQWKDRTSKTGKKFTQRYRRKIDEFQPTGDNATGKGDSYEAREKEWQESSLNAGLKDRLAYGFKYENKYYDIHGDIIHIPTRYKDVIQAHFHSKNNIATFAKNYFGATTDVEKVMFRRTLSLLQNKRKAHEEAEQKYTNELQVRFSKPETFHQTVDHIVSSIDANNNSINSILATLKAIKPIFNEDLDPTIVLHYNNKTQEIQFDDLVARLQGSDKPKDKNVGITKLEVKDLADYDDVDQDFNKQHLIKQSLEINTAAIDKLAQKIYKKKFAAAEQQSDESDSTLEKGFGRGLVKRVKLIHRGGKTFFATYWVNTDTGVISDNIKRETGRDLSYRHDEFGTGDLVELDGKHYFVKKFEVATKKYPLGAVIFDIGDGKEKAAKLDAIRKIKLISRAGSSDDDFVTVSKTSTSTEKKVVTDFYSKDIVSTLLTSSRTTLGGSGENYLYTSSDGAKYCVKLPRVKDGATLTEQVAEEVLADDIYALFVGAAVYKSKYEGGKKVSTFVKGQTLAASHAIDRKEAISALKQHFLLDCLLDNRDVIGANEDNIIVDDYDGVHRIDNGGSLLYRAKGALKTDFDADIQRTIKNFLDSSVNPSTANVYKGITDEELKSQAKEILTMKDKIFFAIDASSSNDKVKIKDIISKRIKNMEDTILNKAESVKKADDKYSYDTSKYSSFATANFFEHGWDTLELEGNEGIKDHIKNRIIAIEKINESYYKKHAADNRLTLEEYKIKAQQKIEQLVAGSEFFRATDVDYLDKILLTDKRYKSQFETGTSHGSLSPGYRAVTEHGYFGFKNDPKHDKENRPIYGYFSDNKDGAINSKGTNPPENSVSSYGKITVKFKKDRALKKATLCFQDSLGSEDRTTCSPAAKPHFTCLAPGIDILKAADSTSKGINYYTEVQYHNKLTIDDISEIVFVEGNYSDSSKAERISEMNKMVKVARHTDKPIRFV